MKKVIRAFIFIVQKLYIFESFGRLELTRFPGSFVQNGSAITELELLECRGNISKMRQNYTFPYVNCPLSDALRGCALKKDLSFGSAVANTPRGVLAELLDKLQDIFDKEKYGFLRHSADFQFIALLKSKFEEVFIFGNCQNIFKF